MSGQSFLTFAPTLDLVVAYIVLLLFANQLTPQAITAAAIPGIDEMNIWGHNILKKLIRE